MNIKIKNVEFIGGSDVLANLPPNELPEVAMLGRSNVGKSTLVNRLTGRRKMARTSSTPGRTTEINFFKVTFLKDDSPTEDHIVLVDLPGFGYAKFSKEKRSSLSKLTVDYIRQRPNLAAVCLLNDCRRKAEDDELAIQKITFENDIRLIIVITKIDKLNQKERHAQPKIIAESYHLEPSDLVLTGEKTPPEQLWERIINVSL